MAQQSDSVLIVGGGIIGIACAHYLHLAGYRVTVIDRGDIGDACSRGNLGLVCPSHVLPLAEPAALKMGLLSVLNPRAAFRVKPQLRPELLHWMAQFASRCTNQSMLRGGRHLKSILDFSRSEYDELLQTLPSLAETWQPDGLLYVFRSERALREYGKTADLLQQRFDVDSEMMTGEALAQFEPAMKSDLAGAFFFPADAAARPEVVGREWWKQLEKDGVAFMPHTELKALTRARGKVVSVATSEGDMQADHYVFATGAWSRKTGKLLGWPLPVEPGKGYSITARRGRGQLRYPALFPEHHIGITPFGGDYRLGSMMEFAGFDESIPKRRIRQLISSANHYLEKPHSTKIREQWYGWRPMTWDSLPIIGRIPRLSNAIVATGHNMLGFALAPATGRLVAEIAEDAKTTIDALPFSPSRF